MPNLIKTGDTKIITKDGEVFVNISLELNIKLDGNNLSIQANDTNEIKKQEDKTDWVIPSFKSKNKKKINFGDKE